MGSGTDEAEGSGGNTYGLTPGQMKVLELLVRGLDRGQIAVKTGVSIHTVNSQLESTFRKLNVKCATAAVARAVGEKIVPYSPADGSPPGDK